MLPPAVHSEIDRIARELGQILACLSCTDRAAVMLSFVTQAAKEIEDYDRELANALAQSLQSSGALRKPTDVRPATSFPKSEPIPPDVLSEVKATFNEAEIIETITEIRSGKGRRFEEVIGDLRRTANMPNE
jgi:hypothetical protein